MSNPNVMLGPEARVIIAGVPFGVTEGTMRFTADVPEKTDTEEYPFKTYGQQGLIGAEVDIGFQQESDRAIHNIPYAIYPSRTVEIFVLPQWNNLAIMYYFPLLVVRDFTHSFAVSGSPPQPGRISGVCTGEFVMPSDSNFRACNPKRVEIPLYADLIAAIPPCTTF